jgi:hypothetical protein
MKLLLVFSIFSAALSLPVYDEEYDLDIVNNHDTLERDNYADQDDSVDLDFDNSDNDELNIPGSPVYVDLTPCGSNSLLSVTSLKLNPDPPKTGENLSLIADGVLRAPIVEGAQLRVTVKLGFLPLYDQTDMLCDLARNNGLDCPIGVGEHSIVAGFPVPAIAPKVMYSCLL